MVVKSEMITSKISLLGCPSIRLLLVPKSTRRLPLPVPQTEAVAAAYIIHTYFHFAFPPPYFAHELQRPLCSGIVREYFLCYCSRVMFREVFFVNKVHRKPEDCGAKSCKA